MGAAHVGDHLLYERRRQRQVHHDGLKRFEAAPQGRQEEVLELAAWHGHAAAVPRPAARRHSLLHLHAHTHPV